MKNILCLLLLFILSVHSQAQEADTTIQLTPLDITAPYKAVEQSPFTYQNLTLQRLEKVNYGQEASFILSQTPSMTVYSDAGSSQGYSYYRMRGMDQTRVNMTLDGVPLNEPEDQGVYFSNYPDFLNSVDQVQIQRGVGSSKNGNSSYAGSIQFTSPNLHDPQKTEIGLGYGSFNTYRGYSEYNSGIKTNKGLYLRASHLHSDGYRYRSANTSQSVFFSAGLFEKRNQLKLVGLIGNQKNELAWLGVPKAQIDQDPRTNVNSNEDDQFAQGLIQLQHAYTISDNSEWQTSIYYNHLQGNYDFDLNNFLGDPNPGPMLNYAFSSHFFGGFSNYTIEANQLTFTTGLHANHYSRSHEGSSSDDGTLYENTGLRNDLSGIMKLNYTLQNVSLYGDLQVRHTSFDYEGTTDFERMDWTFVNPKAGINVALGKQSNLYYSVSKTSREPTRNDLFGGEDNLETDESGNPLLYIVDPEIVVDQELGFRIHSKNYHFNANLFYMDFNNEIVLNGQFGPNGLALTSKVDKSYRAGLEIDGWNQLHPNFKITHSLSYNKSEIKEDDITFSPILYPEFIWFEEVELSLNQLVVALNGRYQNTSYLDFANTEKLESYILFNARFGYDLNDHLSVNLFLNNLTNKQYFNNGYVDYDGTPKYFIQAPINYHLSATWKF